MKTLERHGHVFWNEEEIQTREFLVNVLEKHIRMMFMKENPAWLFERVEAPLLMSRIDINKQYNSQDIFQIENAGVVLRPETTHGSYMYARDLLSHTENKIKMPLCVWQHGKSFRQEPTHSEKEMRLNEFYQLEFQCIYSKTTLNNYSSIAPQLAKYMDEFWFPCKLEPSDRLPWYSSETLDIIAKKTNMEICSISRRTDFENANVLEIAFGTDRILYNYLRRYKDA